MKPQEPVHLDDAPAPLFMAVLPYIFFSCADAA